MHGSTLSLLILFEHACMLQLALMPTLWTECLYYALLSDLETTYFSVSEL